MIHMLIVDGQADELWLIQREAHEQAALLTDERWEIRGMLHLEVQEISESEVLDIVYLDVTDAQGLATAMTVRKWWKNVYMVLIVSESLSPVQYLRPSIMAASVLLRPVEQMQAAESIREAIHWLPGKADDEDVFVFADRDGKLRIPYGQILYFEARAKKIYIALQNEEYGFYDSMDHLVQNLPDYFFRCHRSYIVNMHHLRRYQASQALCILTDDVEIPVSRSYRPLMKEKFSVWKTE